MAASAIPQDLIDPLHPTQTHELGFDQSQSHSSESNPSDSGSLQRALAGLKEAFLTSLEEKKDVIEATVRHHLRVRSCHLGAREVWKSALSTSFFRSIFQPAGLSFAYPIPVPDGEDQCPGNVEEKLRTEIATYIWLRENCPDIPIPELHAFGLPDGSAVK
ncbi:hypothetical protein J3459_007781 [Metarhizium acridum]|nr:hypothetical protein J3459_007781 [Metarhizium acridum]